MLYRDRADTIYAISGRVLSAIWDSQCVKDNPVDRLVESVQDQKGRKHRDILWNPPMYRIDLRLPF